LVPLGIEREKERGREKKEKRRRKIYEALPAAISSSHVPIHSLNMKEK
jgi:hypothetical protein